MGKKIKQTNNIVRGDQAAGNIYKNIYQTIASDSPDLSKYSNENLEKFLQVNEKALEEELNNVTQLSSKDKKINHSKIKDIKKLALTINRIRDILSLRKGIIYQIIPIDERINNAIKKGREIRKEFIRNTILVIASCILILFFLVVIANKYPNKKLPVEKATKNFVIQNTTPFRVDFVICYYSLEENWIVSGWWNVEPYKVKELIIETNLNHFYFYGIGDNGEYTGQNYDENDVWLWICSEEMNFNTNAVPNSSTRRKVLFNRKDFIEGVCKISLSWEY